MLTAPLCSSESLLLPVLEVEDEMTRDCKAGADDGFVLLRCRSIQPDSVWRLALSELVI